MAPAGSPWISAIQAVPVRTLSAMPSTRSGLTDHGRCRSTSLRWGCCTTRRAGKDSGDAAAGAGNYDYIAHL
jgi:hypothetical protein